MDTPIRALTFDYFGTLVDVDQGASKGMAKVLQSVGLAAVNPRDAYLAWDEANVRLYRTGPYRKYRECAVDAMAACLSAFGAKPPERAQLVELTEAFLSDLVESSPPQPEVPDILDALKDRYILMPITNMDSDLWARSTLARYFPKVTTAEMARAYKPSERIFRLGMERVGVARESVLHVAISPWADIEGGKAVGLKVAWINRANETLGPWTPRPDYEFKDVAGLKTLLS